MISGSVQAGETADVCICPNCTISANKQFVRHNSALSFFSIHVRRSLRPGLSCPVLLSACQADPALCKPRPAAAGRRSSKAGEQKQQSVSAELVSEYHARGSERIHGPARHLVGDMHSFLDRRATTRMEHDNPKLIFPEAPRAHSREQFPAGRREHPMTCMLIDVG